MAKLRVYHVCMSTTVFLPDEEEPDESAARAEVLRSVKEVIDSPLHLWLKYAGATVENVKKEA